MRAPAPPALQRPARGLTRQRLRRGRRWVRRLGSCRPSRLPRLGFSAGSGGHPRVASLSREAPQALHRAGATRRVTKPWAAARSSSASHRLRRQADAEAGEPRPRQNRLPGGPSDLQDARCGQPWCAAVCASTTGYRAGLLSLPCLNGRQREATGRPGRHLRCRSCLAGRRSPAGARGSVPQS